MRFDFFAVTRTLLPLAVLAASLTAAPADARAEDPPGMEHAVKVDRVSFPVTLSDGSVQSIVGYLYFQGSHRHRTLQVTLHGGNYNHKYWDIPDVGGRDYSYARYMAEQGYAVLALDRLGAGESSHPDADFLTIDEEALGLHQLLAGLRADENPIGHAFSRVVLVGHSFGSHTAVYVQGVYGDADALVSTSAIHVPGPAVLDPDAIAAVAAQNPYFRLPPEARRGLFYWAPGVDPAIVDYDVAALDDVIPRGYVFSIFPFFTVPAVTRVEDVTCPVLVQLGEDDAIAPGSLATAEAATFAGASSVTTQVIPAIGHSLNGHYNNVLSWERIDGWISATVGRR